GPPARREGSRSGQRGIGSGKFQLRRGESSPENKYASVRKSWRRPHLSAEFQTRLLHRTRPSAHLQVQISNSCNHSVKLSSRRTFWRFLSFPECYWNLHTLLLLTYIVRPAR